MSESKLEVGQVMNEKLEREIASLESLARDIAMTAKQMRRRLEERLADEYCGIATWTVLVHVMIAEQQSQAALARQIGIAKSTLTRHLDRMEANGLIQRLPDPDDDRKILITSTPLGREVQHRFRQRATEEGDRMLAGISDEDKAGARRVLAQIRLNITAEGEGR